MHISSIVVVPRPGAERSVRALLGDMSGIEVHGTSAAGHLVVTIETATDDAMVSTVQCIARMRDVLSASMVYHQQESDPEAEITLAASQGSRTDKEV